VRDADDDRALGLWDAVGVGVGAIVGGGILALAGVAFAATGPSAMLAFAANGAIAVFTALSFGQLAARFPESGGTYTFAKKVLSVEAAFLVGWVVWFASIMAAVLYALGFAAFTVVMLERLLAGAGAGLPDWLAGRGALVALAVAATLYYAASLLRHGAGGGQWATIGKVVVFAAVIAGGAFAFATAPPPHLGAQLTPFFTAGASGVIQAMGYTFIALQGFDLIAAVGGEVRDPARNLPRSMLISLAIALAIYLPLLFFTTTVGIEPGESIAEASRAGPETILARAAERFVGPAGYWLVVLAAILSMLSALQANLYGASRVALAMARDRTLPEPLGRLRQATGTPGNAVLATAAAVIAIAVALPDVADAGAASSLIFLITFAIAHWTNLLVRRRSGAALARGLAAWPWLPLLGGVACLGLAVLQGFAVAAAGGLVALWLALGLAFYLTTLAPRARVADAAALALDPSLVQLRGQSPLVLVPIANPASARGLIGVARALVTPRVGRALVLSVVKPPDDPSLDDLVQVRDLLSLLSESLYASFQRALTPETLITVGADPWDEIARVVRTHRCESLLVGIGRLEGDVVTARLEDLMARIACDVVVLRAAPEWRLSNVRRVLIPVGGRRDQSLLRARLLGSMQRTAPREIDFLRVLPESASPSQCAQTERELRALANDELPGAASVELVQAADPVAELVRRAAGYDLVVLGAQRRQRAFGAIPLRLARETDRALILISRA
jgi:basic amino acid/polyamine antiporter, APA family